MNDALPYRITYAAEKTKCEKCRHKIKQGELEIAIMVQSNEHDCQYPTWYHQQCFFKTRLPPTEAAFDGFAQLRYDHQLAIKRDLGIGDIKIDQTEAATVDEKLQDFMISYAKITPGTCTDCRKPFKQSDMRIMRVVQVAKVDKNQNNDVKSGQANWYHVACFVRQRSEIGWLYSGSLLPGFKRLSAEDKEMIQSQIPDSRAIATASGSTDMNSMDLEKEIQIQNHKYYKIYDFILQNVPKVDQIGILNLNSQTKPDTDAQIVHHLTDVIYFGALKRCKSCKKGRPIFSNWTYKCTHGSGWTTCGKEDKEPPRIRAEIPQEMWKKYEYLRQRSGVRTRTLHSFKFVDDHGNDLVYAPYKKPPLFNMEFVLVGTFKKPRANIEQLVKKLGGKVGTMIDDRVAAVISTMEEVQKMDKQMMDAREHKIQVVTEEFLDDIQILDTDPILYIICKSISEWGGDPYARIEENDVATRRETIFYTKSLPEKITLKWKDGSAVDPECGLDENAHVYSARLNHKKHYYSVILGLVDIEHNKNSYYRMQLLESNDQNLYWVFESWGRIGTVVGSKQLKNYGKLDEALERFHSIYKDKTDNKFGVETFQKRPNKFYHLDVDVGVSKKVANTLIPTKLDAPVYDLMQMLFDIKQMENIMCGCDLDLKQMPLGKINITQIEMALSTLGSIAKLLARNASIHELRDASNKFYTLVPHTFGVKHVPIIDSIAAVTAKSQMIESLLNMETVYSFLEGENGEKVNPFDACYRKLKANIVPIAKDSDEFQLFSEIVRNSNELKYRQYTLEVLEMFKVERDGENTRFQHHFPQHKLLWHGSRLMNFASILSNGLKIAPPEAPANGYRFGKGVYFADCVAKSAHYCSTNPNNDTGLLVLCEVALGNTKEVMDDELNVVDIPNAEYQSITGVGKLAPLDYRKIDGVVVPYWADYVLKPSNYLTFNEYVVYDTNQVKIKYLFKVKFNYK